MQSSPDGFFYAVGYNVPQEYLTSFHVDSLVIDDGITYKDESGHIIPFTQETLQGILSRVSVGEDGRVRCLASALLPNVKGPFSFSGTRRGDKNDWCRHEHRRELRALQVFCAFVNHWDLKDANTMDIYVGEKDQGYLRHYLLDFGTALGSGKTPLIAFRKGYSNSFDINNVVISYLTLGLIQWPWDRAMPGRYRSVGYFESEMFHPDRFETGYPLPALENMTNRDAFWAAKIVMSFRDEHLKALVDAGRLSNPAAAQYLLEQLIARRDKIGRVYYQRVNPLDRFDQLSMEDSVVIAFRDLAVDHNLVASSTSAFEVRFRGRLLIVNRPADKNRIVLTGEDIAALISAQDADDIDNRSSPDGNVFEISILTQRPEWGLSPPVVLSLCHTEEVSGFRLVGIEHKD